MKDLLLTQRLDKHAHLSKEKLVPYPPFPETIKIEVTGRCNFKCSYCAASNPLRPRGDMDKNFLYRILREAKSLGVREIGMFMLGESFLVKDLPEYIRYAKKEVGIDYVFITTNGSLCTPERLISVTNAGLDSLKFSINAGTRKRYKEMHGVDCFDKVISHIKWFHEYKKKHNIKTPKSYASSIFLDKYKEELENLRSMISPYVSEFYYVPLHIGRGEYTALGNPSRLNNMVPAIPCWPLFNAGKITWDGWLTACYYDGDRRFDIADLNKISLSEAWHHPKYVKLRKQHLSKDLKNSLCAKCAGY